MTINYGITQLQMKVYRAQLQADNKRLPGHEGYHFGYLMAQLAQSYRTRKVMYGNPVRN